MGYRGLGSLGSPPPRSNPGPNDNIVAKLYYNIAPIESRLLLYNTVSGYSTRRGGGARFGGDNKTYTRRIRRTGLTWYYNNGRARSERTTAVVLSRFFTGHFRTRT